MKKRQFPVWSVLLATVLLAGCSKADTDLLPDGTQPVTLTATMEGQTAPQAAKAATRATSTNTWAGGEQVAVQIDGEVKQYTVQNATTGMLVAALNVTPFYWTSSTKIVEAWATHSLTAKPTSFTVKADQSFDTGLGYQQSDMIYASATISYVSPELEFKHLPVKVVVNLKAGEGVTESEVQNATVSIMGQNLTSGTITANWIVAQLATGSDAITPNTLATPTTDYQKTVQALLVPQKNTATTPFIKVNVGGQEFFYSTTLDFAAGTQHTYNITVLKSGLSVMASGAQAWGAGSTTDVTSADIYTAADLKIGDYYYSDGKWSDGGYRKYADNSTAHLPVMPVLTDASGNPRTVEGIVFFKRDATAPQDAGGYTEFAGTPTGYIVGLNENTSQWNDEYIGDDRQSSPDIMNGYNESYTVTNNLNSIAIKWCKNHIKIPNTSTTTFSNWYMTSMKELKMLADAISLINGNITLASGTTLGNKFYSTANRMGNSGNFIFVLNPLDTSADVGYFNNSLTANFCYRAACAFQLK